MAEIIIADKMEETNKTRKELKELITCEIIFRKNGREEGFRRYRGIVSGMQIKTTCCVMLFYL